MRQNTGDNVAQGIKAAKAEQARSLARRKTVAYQKSQDLVAKTKRPTP